MRQILLGTALAIAFAAVSFSPASAKTATECKAEYAANKAAIKGTQKKADFITACRAGTEVVPGTAAAAPAAVRPNADCSTGYRCTATSTGFFGRKKAASAPSAPSGVECRLSPVQTNSNPKARHKARCPAATVVWVNTKSGMYHFAGSRNYGHTKSGAYMCEADATAAGRRASKDEKHP